MGPRSIVRRNSARICRAENARALRPDVTTNDLFTAAKMVEAVIDFAGPVAPDAWRRYLAIVLDGLRAEGVPRAPLTEPSLTDEQVESAKIAAATRG